MKTLIAVASYSEDADRGGHEAIRQTWGKDAIQLGFDLRFFIGRRRQGWNAKFPDEIMLDPTNLHERLKDEIYWQNLYREIYLYAFREGYDFVFVCCNDTFIVPKKLKFCGFEKFDCSGFFTPEELPIGTKSPKDIYGQKLYGWPDAGVGYFLSRKACEILLVSAPTEWPCDIHAGQIFGPMVQSGKIKLDSIKGFWNNIAWHYRWISGQPYHPNSGWQQQMQNQYGEK